MNKKRQIVLVLIFSAAITASVYYIKNTDVISCMIQNKSLTDRDKIEAAFKGLGLNLERGRGSRNMPMADRPDIPDHVSARIEPYKNIADFMKKNPQCCKIINENDGYNVNLRYKIKYTKSKSYFDHRSIERSDHQAIVSETIAFDNCGKNISTDEHDLADQIDKEN